MALAIKFPWRVYYSYSDQLLASGWTTELSPLEIGWKWSTQKYGTVYKGVRSQVCPHGQWSQNFKEPDNILTEKEASF